jgi:hypothetical protein
MIIMAETLSIPLPGERSFYQEKRQTGTITTVREWTRSEKNLFRFFFIFFAIQIVPLDWKFYREIFSISWSHLHFWELLQLTRYMPRIFSEGRIPAYGIASYADWAVFALIATIGAIVWTRYDRQTKEYNKLYYWLRVIVRHRLAIGLLAYGFYKLFPIQMPYPSLSNLNTNYGDFFTWKIYFQTTGIAPKYESFLGFVEILAAFLLFNRRTATFGAGLIIGFLGNVAVANGFYDIGEHKYSAFLVLMSVFIIVYDVPRLYSLLVKEKRTLANRFVPSFSNSRLRKARFFFKAAFVAFALFFGFKTYADYSRGNYLIPQTPGLSGAYGYYNVKEFRLNNQLVPYSTTDHNRWQDVIFEKWATVSLKINRPVKIDLSNGNELHENDIDRNYELAGLAGRHYFYYTTDTVKQVLSLQNKNKNHRNEKLVLHYQRPDDNTIILSGINENSDSVYVVLDKIDKKYMMYEGRRKPVKL